MSGRGYPVGLSGWVSVLEDGSVSVEVDLDSLVESFGEGVEDTDQPPISDSVMLNDRGRVEMLLGRFSRGPERVEVTRAAYSLMVDLGGRVRVVRAVDGLGDLGGLPIGAMTRSPSEGVVFLKTDEDEWWPQMDGKPQPFGSEELLSFGPLDVVEEQS